MQYHRFHPESENDVTNRQKILMAAPGYHLLIEGHLPEPDAAVEYLHALQPWKTMEDKYFFGVKHSGVFIGCFDVVRDYPGSKTAYIGLLLFVESEQSKSYGVQVLQHIKGMVEQWGCTRLCLAVIENNRRALAFWKREGFVELFRKKSDKYSHDAVIMEFTLKKQEL